MRRIARGIKPLVEALAAVFCFEAIGHLGEQHHTADAEIPGAPHFTQQAIGLQRWAPGMAPMAVGGPFVHKQGVNEIGSTDVVLAQWPAGQVYAAVGGGDRRYPWREA